MRERQHGLPRDGVATGFFSLDVVGSELGLLLAEVVGDGIAGGCK